MFGILGLVSAFIILYVLSRIFTQKLFNVLFRITNSREKASRLLGLIFLPGTFVHEASHFITALFLLVPVGQMNLMPEIEENGIKLGSVSIGKTDFFRGSLIGLAPLIIGGSLILWAISFSLNRTNPASPWIVVLLIYIIFELTHTMFSSWTDLRAVLELVVFIALLVVLLLLFKVHAPFLFLFQKLQEASPFLLKLSLFLGIPIGLEIVFLSLFRKA